MSSLKILAIVLIAAGALGLAYGGFTYANGRQEMHVGSISMTVTDRRTFDVPIWAGIAVIAIGVTLLLVPARKG